MAFVDFVINRVSELYDFMLQFIEELFVNGNQLVNDYGGI
jgi:hypothetical protein